MDPFDRCIVLCQKILAMMSGLPVHPMGSEVNQELADSGDKLQKQPRPCGARQWFDVGFQTRCRRR
jgi:hypothetical protein